MFWGKSTSFETFGSLSKKYSNFGQKSFGKFGKLHYASVKPFWGKSCCRKKIVFSYFFPIVRRFFRTSNEIFRQGCRYSILLLQRNILELKTHKRAITELAKRPVSKYYLLGERFFILCFFTGNTEEVHSGTAFFLSGRFRKKYVRTHQIFGPKPLHFG